MATHPRSLGAALAALLAAVLTIFALTASPALSHGDDEHSGHGTTKPVAPDGDRCDLGFNTKAFNDATRNGTQASVPGKNFQGLFMAPLTWQQQLGADKSTLLRSIFGWAASAQMLDGRKKAGHLDHPLIDTWGTMTDPVQCDDLKKVLEDTRAYAAKYPTLGDATADGFEYITPWFAGAGAHLGKWDSLDETIEPGKPEVLIYDGNSKDSHVVGAMYAVLSPNAAPAAVFPGANDIWHQHKGLCWTDDQKKITQIGLTPSRNLVIGGEAADNTWCKTLWNGHVEPLEALYMMHMWVVPGCSSNYGVFSHDLPYLTFRNYVLNAHKPETRGCGSGLAPDADLTGFETNELNIPGKLSTYQSSSLRWWQGNQRLHSGPVKAKLAAHPGAAHANGEMHLAGTLETDTGFAGTTGSWPVSFLRETDGTIHGSLTTPAGTVMTFPSATATRTEHGVLVTAWGKVPGGASVSVAIEIVDPGQRSWFLDPVPVTSDDETFAIHHPAHGHDHDAGPVTYALASHPGSAHGANEEHLFGTATTGEGFTGLAGVWTISFLKNDDTHAITGYAKSPDGTLTFNFNVTDHHDSDECAGGVHVMAQGAEAATPTDPQNPEFIICDPAVTTFFADHDHSGTTPTTPGATTPAHEH